MTFAELLSVLAKSPELIAILLAGLTAISFAMGAVGTAIEELGAVMKWPFVERLGQRIEALFSELPKLWRGSRAPLRSVQAKDSNAAVSDNDTTDDWKENAKRASGG